MGDRDHPTANVGSAGLGHRLRLGFSPTVKVPTPHIRNGVLVFQREDGWVQVFVPVDELQRAPWWKAPLGGQEFHVGDIIVMPLSPTGGL